MQGDNMPLTTVSLKYQQVRELQHAAAETGITVNEILQSAAEMAIKHKFQGELTVFIREAKDLDFLSDYSQKLIASDLCDAVLYGWCDLLNEDYNAELKLIKRE